MAITISCPLTDRDRNHIVSAARWIEASYGDVAVRLTEKSALLETETRSEHELHSIWRSGLLNERLVVEGKAHRAAVLDDLVR